MILASSRSVLPYLACSALVALGKPLKIIGYAFGCLIGLYFMASAFLNRKNQSAYDPRLAAALLRVDAEAILERYKELDFYYRKEAAR
jgi:hypothetical protein